MSKKKAIENKPDTSSRVAKAIIIFFGIVIVVMALNAGRTPTPTADESPAASAETPAEEKKPTVPAEYVSALAQGTTYASTMNMSKQGVYDQLVSQYGGKFTAEAAQYAIDNLKADWNANALASAKQYQDSMHMSPAAIRDQLVSAYGAKFTASEADYAIANLNK